MTGCQKTDKEKRRKKLPVSFQHCVFIALFLFIIVALAFGGGRLYFHERAQARQIEYLEEQLSLVKSRLFSEKAEDVFISNVSKGFDYLAIGNSITIHGIADYWWDEVGMAASKKELDYFHRVVAALGEDTNAAAYNYSVWKIQAHDRAETYETLDKWLINGIDLITVQLSENCSDLTTFREDFRSLLQHISSLCPTAQIIVVDDFWNDEKHEMKESVCEELGICFADLSDIRNKDEYKAGLGTWVYGSDGTAHIIEHDGVAEHPGDNAMAVIAQRILDRITSR